MRIIYLKSKNVHIKKIVNLKKLLKKKEKSKDVFNVKINRNYLGIF